jgi:nucleoside-diphosphate-sugar epimerase
VLSPQTIYEACLEAGVKRFIHLSSAVVYGDVPEPITDDAPPVSGHWMPYARAKAASEVWLRERMGRDALEVIVLRPGIVWGVRSPHTMDLARALAGKGAFLVNDGRGVFNGVYIANLVAAIRAAGNAPSPSSGFYNVGDAETVTWQQFFASLGAPLGCDPQRLARVSGDRFPWSVASFVDMVQNLPVVNGVYHKLKTHIPDGLKAIIRARLEGGYVYERPASGYSTQPGVSRELWHLQRVGHKLPIDKFGRTFGFTPPVPFNEAMRRTVAWLTTLGSTERHTAVNPHRTIHAGN